jgi:Fe-Mn family superoxide dismutase
MATLRAFFGVRLQSPRLAFFTQRHGVPQPEQKGLAGSDAHQPNCNTAMTTIHVTNRTRSTGVNVFPQRRASDSDPVTEVGALSRIVERDLQVLKKNLAQHRCDATHDEEWEGAWTRLESAWETVRSELVDDSAANPPTEVISSQRIRATGVPPLEQESSATAPTAQFIDRLPGMVRNLARSISSAGAAHAREGKIWLTASSRAQVENWVRARHRMGSARNVLRVGFRNFIDASNKFASANAARLHMRLRGAGRRRRVRVLTDLTLPPSAARRRVAIVGPSEMPGRAILGTSDDARGSSRSSFDRSARESKVTPLGKVSSTLTLPTQVSSATVAAGPFIVQPLPWLAGALAPVLSSRAIQIHHGIHHATCIALANQLSGERPELAHKSSLEIVCWAREHARDTALFTATSEAWNHALLWQSLTPSRKRPEGELCRAIDEAFGNYSNLAGALATAGATHVGSGWLWLVVNHRNQVKILTTSGTDSPEYRGTACLLAIDLWEHAYYFDHHNRRREYLDALIDRRLDWDFAAARYRLAFEQNAKARRESKRRANHDKIGEAADPPKVKRENPPDEGSRRH